jgi:hypothetical protein
MAHNPPLNQAEGRPFLQRSVSMRHASEEHDPAAWLAASRREFGEHGGVNAGA